MAIEASQRAALIDQMQGGLVLAGGAEVGQTKSLLCFPPGSRQELVGTGGGAGIAPPDGHLGMARQAGKAAAPVENPVTVMAAAHPGAFREADGVEQGAALWTDGIGRGLASGQSGGGGLVLLHGRNRLELSAGCRCHQGQERQGEQQGETGSGRRNQKG